MEYKQLYDKAITRLYEENKKISAQDRNVVEYVSRYYCEGYDHNSKADMYRKLKEIFVDDNVTINIILNTVLHMRDNKRQSDGPCEKYNSVLFYALNN